MKTYISRSGNKYYLEQIKNIKGVTDKDGNPFTKQQELDSWMIQRSGKAKLVQMKFESFKEVLIHIESQENPIKNTIEELLSLVDTPEDADKNNGEIVRLRTEFIRLNEELYKYLHEYLK